MINSLKKLVDYLDKWIADKIPSRRLKNDVEGRLWALQTLEYRDGLKLEQLRNVTDRSQLNTLVQKRFNESKVKAKKGISALKVEVSALYGFTKCFVQRYKGRMHFYRDDLSQKGARNMASVAHAMADFEEFKKNLDD